MKHLLEESLEIWNDNAVYWDRYMGDESNEFHREVVRPKVTELLDLKENDYILDIACGNGNYSKYLAQRGIKVVAFDYSSRMVELAKKRQHQYLDKIEFNIADASDIESLRAIKRDGLFTKAVSNMAVMDIYDIEPLFQYVNEILVDDGVFVFATQHPCFVTLTDKYMSAHSYYDIALVGQPRKQCYYHRSLQDILNVCFKYGFVIDGFYESSYKNNEKPAVMIVRARKVGK